MRVVYRVKTDQCHPCCWLLPQGTRCRQQGQSLRPLQCQLAYCSSYVCCAFTVV